MEDLTRLHCMGLPDKLAQVAVAVVSLTFSIEDGKDWRDAYFEPGVANATNLTCYFDSFNGQGCGSNVASQALAHAYGDLALSSDCGPYTEISDILNSKRNYRYYCRRTRHRQEFAVRFNEYNPDDRNKVYPRFTNRVITASSGECFTYSMVGSAQPQPNGDLLYTYTNSTSTDNITIPAQSGTFNGTTYVYRGVKTPQDAGTYACGDRCIKMWAHKSRGHGENSTFYECPITVNAVSNTTNDTQKVSNDMARLAAASIALQGRPEGNAEDEKIWTQYQLYAYG
ncbi:MAG: hypothetical protein Q9217_004800 [Psora testacea]